jgi:signal transduction histidine kinase
MAGLPTSATSGHNRNQLFRNKGIEKRFQPGRGKARSSVFEAHNLPKLDPVTLALFAEIGRVREEERQKIAAELHDQIGQNLVLAKMRLEGLKSTLGMEYAALIGGISDLISHTIHDTRSLIHELHSEWLSQVSLKEAVNWLAEQTQKKYGLRCVTEFAGSPKSLRKDVGAVLFQAVRELLVNAAKHAAASKVNVSCECGKGWLRLHIVDDGRGFDPALRSCPNSRTGGFGLMIVRVSLDLIGGLLEMDSHPGAGTRATITVPLEAS